MHETAEMELNSRFCEVSTYAQSSGYNSSTASSSLNYIDDDHCVVEKKQIIEINNNKEDPGDSIRTPTTTLIITITLVKFEEKVEKVID